MKEADFKVVVYPGPYFEKAVANARAYLRSIIIRKIKEGKLPIVTNEKSDQ